MRRPSSFVVVVAALGSISALASAAHAQLPISRATQATLESRFPRNADDLRRIEKQVKQVVEQALPATVAVFVGHSAGSGVVINPEGLVLTAAHVVGRAGRRVRVVLPDGRNLAGRSLGANHDIDAGLIQITDPPEDLPHVPMAKKRRLLPGEWVVTTGQPGGLIDDRTPPIRLGRVLFSEDDVVCTDCTLVGGDSGGPLISMRGEVVGIHSSIGPDITHNFHVATTGFEGSWDRLVAGEVWGGHYDEVLAFEDRPLLGVTGHSTEDGQCLITRVLPGLPAEKAGIAAGDIILKVDGREIDSFKELSRIVFRKKPGSTVTLRVAREEDVFETKVRVASAGEILEGHPSLSDE